MNTPYIIYIAIVGCIVLYLVACNKCRRHPHLQQQYTSLLISTIIDNSLSREPLINIGLFKSRNILTQSIHSIISHTYGCDNPTVKQIIKQHHLTQHIIRRLHISSTLRKCKLLSHLASVIDADTQSISTLEAYLRNGNHHLRIGALIALLAARPSKVMSTLLSIEFRLQPLDIVRIISLIRQGRITVALEPLFESGNCNLQMLGMALVRTFGIGIVDKQLYNIIKTEADPDLIYDAIYTLTYLKRPLRYKVIRECIASMPDLQRKRLCRHLSIEGYSMQCINAVLSPSESLYAKQLITSFKRQLSQAI